MTDAIIIDYDVFAQESRLYIMKNGERSSSQIASDIHTLASDVIGVAQKTGIYNVKIHAPFAFMSEINRQIKQLEMTTYAENKIMIEGL
ncbi:MAG: hypothetical protein NC218_09420 [Acetobacter sp.]|nr:hypothetical protein [Acetobacter sp.]